MRIKLTIAYTGTDFCGWQVQSASASRLEQPTVQACLMRAVEQVAGVPLHVHGSGRTDSGVHARAQVAHMDIPERMAGINWQRALNVKLPPAVRIVRAEPVAEDFHAQFSAVGKTYCYALWLDRRYTPPFIHPFVWSCGPLDEGAMDAAAAHMVGTHDFTSLRNMGTDVKTTVRTVSVVRRESTASAAQSPLRLWRFEANGFLKQMVRNMMGLLVFAGKGNIAPDAVPEILAAKNRSHGGATAPAQGLCLYRVWYADDMPEVERPLMPWWHESSAGDCFPL